MLDVFPLNFTDPTGHAYDAGANEGGKSCNYDASLYDCIYPENWPDESKHGYVIEPPPDAHGFGVSINASLDTPFASLEAMGGKEIVYDPDTREATMFLVVGGDLKVGISDSFIKWLKELFKNDNPVNLSVSPYYAKIYNVDNVVTDYSGPFIYSNTTASYKVGLSVGETWSPGDPNRESAYAETFGVATGYALTTQNGASYYIPLYTTGPGHFLPEYHVAEWISIVFGE